MVQISVHPPKPVTVQNWDRRHKALSAKNTIRFLRLFFVVYFSPMIYLILFNDLINNSSLKMFLIAKIVNMIEINGNTDGIENLNVGTLP